MVLVIESSDPAIIQALSEAARSMNVAFHVVPDETTASQAERNRRSKVLRKFKGGLKKHFTGYQPGKHDWYQQ